METAKISEHFSKKAKSVLVAELAKSIVLGVQNIL